MEYPLTEIKELIKHCNLEELNKVKIMLEVQTELMKERARLIQLLKPSR
jgi:hypothetical protein